MWPNVLPATVSGARSGWLGYQPSRRSPPLLVIPAPRAGAPSARPRPTASTSTSTTALTVVRPGPCLRAVPIAPHGGVLLAFVCCTDGQVTDGRHRAAGAGSAGSRDARAR